MKATVVINLDEAGHKARDIMIVSLHKSERSIHSYATRCPPKKKQKMTNDLSKEFNPGSTKEPSKFTATAVQNRIVTEDPEPQGIPNQENSINDQELNVNVGNVPNVAIPIANAPVNMSIQNQNEGNIVPYVPDLAEDPLADDHFLEVIENIEKQNKEIAQTQNQKQNLVLNQDVQNEQNINNPRPMIPAMYFHIVL